ncbi:MAG: hypothetical protein ACOYXY_15335, partial [Thermodesulfobacteriota bacterium]
SLSELDSIDVIPDAHGESIAMNENRPPLKLGLEAPHNHTREDNPVSPNQGDKDEKKSLNQ